MMHAPRQSPSPRARESCFKPVMTHTRTSRRVSRRFTTGKTSRPQWATSLLGWHGPRTAGGRTETYNRGVQECRGVVQERHGTGSYRNVAENRAQECHAQGGMGRTDRRESCSWEPLHLAARGSRTLTPGRVMEATGLRAPLDSRESRTPPDPLDPWEPRVARKAPGNPEPPGKQGIRVCPGSRDVGTIRGDEYSSPSGRDDRPAPRSPSGVVHAPGRAFPARVPRSS